MAKHWVRCGLLGLFWVLPPTMPPRPSLNANLTSRSVSAMAHVTTRHCRVRTSAEWYRGLASTHAPCHPKSRSSAAQRVRCLRIRCKRLSVGVGLVPGDSPMCEAQTHLEYWKSGWPRWMRGRRSIRSVCASAVYALWRLACAANARCPARLGRLLARACSHREQARPDSVCRSPGRPLLSSGPGRNLHTPLSRACLQGPPLEGSKAWTLQNLPSCTGLRGKRPNLVVGHRHVAAGREGAAQGADAAPGGHGNGL